MHVIAKREQIISGHDKLVAKKPISTTCITKENGTLYESKSTHKYKK